MSDYTQVNQYTFRDALPATDPQKIIQGLYFDEEFSAISTAITSKYDVSDMSPIPASPADGDSLMSPAAVADMISTSTAIEDFTIGTGADNTNATLYMQAGDVVTQDVNEIQFLHGDPLATPIYAGKLKSVVGVTGLNTTLLFDSPADTPWVEYFYGVGGGGVEQATAFKSDPDVSTTSTVRFEAGLAVTFEESIVVKDGIEITSGIGSPNYIDGSGVGMLDIGAKLGFVDAEDKEVRINTFDVSTGVQNSTLFQADGNVFFPQDIHVQNQDTPSNFYRFFCSQESGVANLVQFEPPAGQSGEFQIVVRGTNTYTWQFGSDGALWRNGVQVIAPPA